MTRSKRLHPWHRWAVAQDLGPFGLRVEFAYPFRWLARLRLGFEQSRYLTIVRADTARSEIERLSSADAVIGEIRGKYFTEPADPAPYLAAINIRVLELADEWIAERGALRPVDGADWSDWQADR